MRKNEDTIAAIITPFGQSGVGVIRLSGKDATAILKRVSAIKKLVSHRIRHAWIAQLDDAIVSYFKSPNSYTGEDVVEISSHGNPIILSKILDLLIKNGARQAERGEFTKRAFLNGKMDLIQAESVMALIGAKTERAISAAVNQIRGKQSKDVEKIMDKTKTLLAEVQASIDFPDEVRLVGVRKKTKKIKSAITKLIGSIEEGKAEAKGQRIVIVGKPNVGKSSIFNALINNEKAIVSKFAGTTRDTNEKELIINGKRYELVDTAGLRRARGELEKLGVKKTNDAIGAADIILMVYDGSKKRDEQDRLVESAIKGMAAIKVVNKADKPQKINVHGIKTIATEGVGIDLIKAAIGKAKERLAKGHKEDIVLYNNRQEAEARKAFDAIVRAEGKIDRLAGKEELVSADLQEALGSIGNIGGSGIGESVVNTIFDSFCVGK